uniref:Cytochrome b5 heme-binding domain-containing protein n=1 Tax=Strigamia maritima TaxID=126957 RepID=T1ITN5_STRMM
MATEFPLLMRSARAEEVGRHKTKDDAWMIINKKVYNITDYVTTHPGGDAILRFAGKDGTTAVQQQSAHKRVLNFINQTLEKYYITDLSCFHRYKRHPEPKEPTIVCLGPSGVGKTLLLEKLKKNNNNNNNNTTTENFIPTIPTTGTNLYTIKLDGQRKHSVIVRELGGVMAPLWHLYLSDADAVIFLVDSSNSFQVAASSVLLTEVLNHSSLDNCPFLLVFNKCDVKLTVMSIDLVQDVMQIPDILKNAKPKVTVMRTSALTEHGLPHLRDWIRANTN